MATVCSRFEKSYALEHSLNDRYRVESEPSPLVQTAGDRSRGVWSRDTRETQSRFRCSDSSSGPIHRLVVIGLSAGARRFGWLADERETWWHLPRRGVSSRLSRVLSSRARAGDYALDGKTRLAPFVRGRNGRTRWPVWRSCACVVRLLARQSRASSFEHAAARGANDKSDACCRLARLAVRLNLTFNFSVLNPHIFNSSVIYIKCWVPSHDIILNFWLCSVILFWLYWM